MIEALPHLADLFEKYGAGLVIGLIGILATAFMYRELKAERVARDLCEDKHDAELKAIVEKSIEAIQRSAVAQEGVAGSMRLISETIRLAMRP